MTRLWLKLKGGAGSGNFNHEGRPGKVGGSGKSNSSSSIPIEGRKSTSAKWQTALNKADTRAVNELSSILPGIAMEHIEVTGDYVQEPRVSAQTNASYSSIIKALKGSGWKTKKVWNKDNDVTYHHPQNQYLQITVDKYEGTGGGNNMRSIRYYPTYDLSEYELD